MDWATHDDFGHRRDHDRDGAYDHAQAAAIIDAWWPLLVDSTFQQVVQVGTSAPGP